jgi:hypothetical protein
MTQHSNLSDYAARLRQLIAQTFDGGANPSADFSEETFNTLSLELFALQLEHNVAYRKLGAVSGRAPGKVTGWREIPAVPTAAFKEMDMTCLSEASRTWMFCSSGTTGQSPSRHYHNEASLALYEASLLAWFKHHLLAGASAGDGADFLMLTPNGEQAPRSSLVHMFDCVRNAFGSDRSTFCGKVDVDGAWQVKIDHASAALQTAERDQRPVVVMGTAFGFVHLLDGLEARGVEFQLPPGSRVLETGGYKGRSRTLPKDELHQWIAGRLGIVPSAILCEYGMSELSSQAYDRVFDSADVARRFQFPPWARVQIVSPETGLEVAEGETGLARVFDLANVWSALAVQTEDLAVRREDGFELIGRAIASEPRGCSLMTV